MREARSGWLSRFQACRGRLQRLQYPFDFTPVVTEITPVAALTGSQLQTMASRTAPSSKSGLLTWAEIRECPGRGISAQSILFEQNTEHVASSLAERQRVHRHRLPTRFFFLRWVDSDHLWYAQ